MTRISRSSPDSLILFQFFFWKFILIKFLLDDYLYSVFNHWINIYLSFNLFVVCLKFTLQFSILRTYQKTVVWMVYFVSTFLIKIKPHILTSLNFLWESYNCCDKALWLWYCIHTLGLFEMIYCHLYIYIIDFFQNLLAIYNFLCWL